MSFSVRYQILGETLGDGKLISPEPVHIQVSWRLGTGNTELGGSSCYMGFLTWGGCVPEPRLPSPHAEADGAHWAFSDVPP